MTVLSRSGTSGKFPRPGSSGPEGEDAAASESSLRRERSIGAYLTRQRELRGISLEQLAELTRIPLRSLQRLEAGQFDDDPDGFVRGFVRTVAQALGLDPADTVARMLDEPSGSGAGAGGRLSIRLGLGLVACGLLVVGVFALGRDLVDGSGWRTGPEVKRIYRKDAVRALAEAAAEVELTRSVEARESARIAGEPPPPR